MKYRSSAKYIVDNIKTVVNKPQVVGSNPQMSQVINIACAKCRVATTFHNHNKSTGLR